MIPLFQLNIQHRFKVVCRRPDGSIRWVEENPNVVTTVGKNDVLDKYFAGSSYTAAHYLGLTDGTPTVAAGDTMASHAGWTEITAYDEANRLTLAWAAASSGSKASSGTFTFTMNASGTAGGLFVVTDNTKGGTSGVLVCVSAFSGGNRAYASADTITATVTVSA